MIRRYCLSCALATLLVSALSLPVPAQTTEPAAPEPKPPVVIQEDITWTGRVTVDSDVEVRKGALIVCPGTQVTFQPGGRIVVFAGAALIAKGDAKDPVSFTADSCGMILLQYGSFTFEHCRFTGLGADTGYKRKAAVYGSVGKGGATLRNSTFTDSAGVWLDSNGPFEMTGCDVRRRPGLFPGESGTMRAKSMDPGVSILVADNTLQNSNLDGGFGKGPAVIRGNVVVGGIIGNWMSGSSEVFDNYVHQTRSGNTQGLLRIRGKIHDNVVRGGNWTMADVGGEITGNLLESFTPAELKQLRAGTDKKVDPTHEHLCGVWPKSTVARNIFVYGSYVAILGIGEGTAADCLIHNNTFDMRGPTWVLSGNHFTKSPTHGIIFRSNLVVRGSGFWDERNLPDSVAYYDYNLWGPGQTRFKTVTITGKSYGDPGFGGHDVPPQGKPTPAPADLVVNPEIEFPFSDDDMLARKHTAADALKLYRAAYALKPGSPAINAGDPADKDDPAVKDGKPDIGALEH